MPSRKKNVSDKSASTSSLGTGEEEWREVQKRVYTNWVNDKLKKTDQHVVNLPKDLGNGIILIKLLEVLSGKKIPGK